MITNIKHLCYILKTDIDTINHIIDSIDDYYISWDKIKTDKDTNLPVLTNGKPKIRQLNSTKKELKRIQKRIYKFLLANVELPEYAFGGIPKRDNVRNAKQHQGNKYIFTTDLKSYFPSITHRQVFSLFLELNFSPTISRILTQLTTYKYQLPQGVPTSTLFANLVFKRTGDKIADYAKSNQLTFTTFVDDLTLSSKTDFKDKIPEILNILVSAGFTISHKKTFYKTKNPIVTGVVCQNNKLKLENNVDKRISRLKILSKTNPHDIKLSKKIEGLIRYRKKVNSFNK